MNINRRKVLVGGKRIHGNCKAVVCITTGKWYDSVGEAAIDNDVYASNLSWHLNGEIKTCGGKRFCFAYEVHKHLHEMVQQHTMIEDKANQYDALRETLKNLLN